MHHFRQNTALYKQRHQSLIPIPQNAEDVVGKRQKVVGYSHELEMLDNSVSMQLSMFHNPCSFYKILPYISSVINL